MTTKDARNLNRKLHITLRPENGIKLTLRERLLLVRCEIKCNRCTNCLEEEHTNWVRFYCKAQESADRRHGIRGYINDSDDICNSFTLVEEDEIDFRIEGTTSILDEIWKRNGREYKSYLETHPEYDGCTDTQKKDVLLNRIIKLRHYGTDEEKEEIVDLEAERQAI